MSLRHGLLGLLAEDEASGYDLARSFEETLGPWAWHAGHSQIYPELRRMLGDGLIEVAGLHSRRRRTYASTGAGRDELRRWLLSPPQEERVRSASALRMFLVGTLEAHKAHKAREAREALRAHAEEAACRLQVLEAQIADAGSEWHDHPFAIGRPASERGRRMLPAARDWALWGIDELDTPPGRRRHTWHG